MSGVAAGCLVRAWRSAALPARTCWAPARGLAVKKKGGNAAGAEAQSAEAAAAAAGGDGAGEVVNGLNILKDGEEIRLRPDSEYPEWVWELHKPHPSLSELLAQAERDGVDSLDTVQQRRLIRQTSRQKIKENNAAKAK